MNGGEGFDRRSGRVHLARQAAAGKHQTTPPPTGYKRRPNSATTIHPPVNSPKAGNTACPASATKHGMRKLSRPLPDSRHTG